MIRFLTAGESHGKALSIIIEGFPSNIEINEDFLNSELKRRQSGYGRGQRMKIEEDRVEIISGIRFGKSLGSPISFLIKNKDNPNWSELMDPFIVPKSYDKIFIPRPGHADLTGTQKYNFNDIRNSIERSSARETACRVIAGSIAKLFLREFNISVGSYVENIGNIYETEFLKQLLRNEYNKTGDDLSSLADRSQLRVLSKEQESKIILKINEVKESGDTLGGTFVVLATGLPVGLGSFMHYDRRLDSEIASSILSINAVKGIEIGGGFSSANSLGSENNDEISMYEESITRTTNYSGGIEGGISNGMPLIIRGAMKPISTLLNPVKSINLSNMKDEKARWERSDFVAVPACSIVAESMVAWSIAKLFLEKFGGDSIEETKDNFVNFTSKIIKRLKNNFEK